MERVPYLATVNGRIYEGIRPMPVCAVLDNFRSLYNVGSLFRTADAVGLERLYLCGITGKPPQQGISKTALGAEDTVAWTARDDAVSVIYELRERGYTIVALETAASSYDLFDWQPGFPVSLLLGNEIDGLAPEALALADVYVQIPMLGMKYSLNVATAAGVALYELLRKYRRLREAARPICSGSTRVL